MPRWPAQFPEGVGEPKNVTKRCESCGSRIEWTTDGEGGLVKRCNCRTHERIPGHRQHEG